MDYSYFDIMKMRRPADSQPGTAGAEMIKGRFPAETPLAMAYVPYQVFGTVYDADAALNRGTLFPELDFPLSEDGGTDE